MSYEKEFKLVKEAINKIRKNTLTGKPLGDDIFITKLEKIFGRKLKTLPRGRPRKNPKMVAVPIKK